MFNSLNNYQGCILLCVQCMTSEVFTNLAMLHSFNTVKKRSEFVPKKSGRFACETELQRFFSGSSCQVSIRYLRSNLFDTL